MKEICRELQTEDKYLVFKPFGHLPFSNRYINFVSRIFNVVFCFRLTFKVGFHYNPSVADDNCITFALKGTTEIIELARLYWCKHKKDVSDDAEKTQRKSNRTVFRWNDLFGCSPRYL